jgi:hypothetical protein
LIEWITTGREWVFSGTTDSLGRLQLQISNAPSGCYRVELESVAAPGLIWPGTTPANYHCR